MGGVFTQSARAVMALADQEARRLNHDYIGTEHLLLGLIKEGARSADVLSSFGVGVHEVEQQIERLVQHGPHAVSSRQLPFTPRAKRAIEFALEEATLAECHNCVGPEHLLLGLLRETDGVAGQVLRELGLDLQAVRAEAMKIRLLQLRIVECAVRPVRASTASKRKIREELLAHLTAIYDEELQRLNNAAAALDEAARRFGEPAELARELELALPSSERHRYFVEHWLGWRAPESAARYLSRLAVGLFVILAAVWCVLAVILAVLAGSPVIVWPALRPGLAFVLLLPAVELTLGLFYFQLRDAMFGVFGSRKSRARVFGRLVLIGLTVLGAGLSFIAVSAWDISRAPQMFWPCFAAAIIAAGGYYLLARRHGPMEIRDTLWASLDLGPLGEG